MISTRAGWFGSGVKAEKCGENHPLSSSVSSAGGGGGNFFGGESSSSGGGSSDGKGPKGSGGSGNENGDGWNRKNITQNCQDHHIIPQQLKDHPLIKLAGFDIHSRANLVFLPVPNEDHASRSDAASMTVEERKKLPPRERRTFHRGKHDGPLVEEIRDKMFEILEVGKAKSWTQSQYNEELRSMISRYRQQLKQGNIALNSNHRVWAERLEKPAKGGK